MADVPFQRTNAGKAVKPKFIGRKICYVEGVDDVAFFNPVSERLGVKFEPAHGKPNSEELARKLVAQGGDYIVVFDNDFDDLLGRRLSDPRVVYLPCYSVENLPVLDLTLDAVLTTFCALSEPTTKGSGLVRETLNREGEILDELIHYDLAMRRAEKENEIMPGHADVIFGNRPGLNFCTAWKLSASEKLANSAGEISAVKSSTSHLSRIRRIEVYLRGHVIFGILRRCFVSAANLLGGPKPTVDNRMFMAFLGEAFWRVGGASSSEVEGAIRSALAAD